MRGHNAGMINTVVFKGPLVLICRAHGRRGRVGVRPLAIDHRGTLYGLVGRAGGVLDVVIDEGHGWVWRGPLSVVAEGDVTSHERD